RAADLEDIDLHIVFTGELFQFFLNAVNFSATFTNDDTWFRGMDGNDQLVQRALDHDLGNTSLIDTGIEVSPDPVVFDQLRREIFSATIPVRFPTTDDP